MQIGVVFPQTELGGDAGAVRAYAQAVEQLGYRHLLVYDHVLGADPTVHAPWSGPYDIHTTFHEPFVLFGYLAGITSLELVTGVIILPQRQTALVAKQAAEVDLLTSGRFRLGVGVGWNRVEYDGLGQDFTQRGRRSGEQVELLRTLWTEQTRHRHRRRRTDSRRRSSPRRRCSDRSRSGSARSHRRLTVAPDGSATAGSRRSSRAPSWTTRGRSSRRRRRTPGAILSTLGMEGRVSWVDGPDEVAAHVARWREVGATHVSINTMKAGFATVDDHLAALESVAAALAR